MKHVVTIGFALIGCTSTIQRSPSESGAGGASSCKANAQSLAAYVKTVLDPDGAPAVPWPTGDAATDVRVEDARSLRRLGLIAGATDEGDRVPGETPPPPPQRTAEDMLVDELARCPIARQEYPRYRSRWTEAFAVSLGEWAFACDCNLNLPLVRALILIEQRGPDPTSTRSGS